MQQYPDTGLPPQGGQGMQFAQTADADQNLQQQGTQFPQDADTLASARRPAKYRHEHKYEISLFEFLSLSKLLQTVMQPDPHADQDGQYLITSLYFDNCFDKALREKKDGLNQRETPIILLTRAPLPSMIVSEVPRIQTSTQTPIQILQPPKEVLHAACIIPRAAGFSRRQSDLLPRGRKLYKTAFRSRLYAACRN